MSDMCEHSIKDFLRLRANNAPEIETMRKMFDVFGYEFIEMFDDWFFSPKGRFTMGAICSLFEAKTRVNGLNNEQFEYLKKIKNNINIRDLHLLIKMCKKVGQVSMGLQFELDIYSLLQSKERDNIIVFQGLNLKYKHNGGDFDIIIARKLSHENYLVQYAMELKLTPASSQKGFRQLEERKSFVNYDIVPLVDKYKKFVGDFNFESTKWCLLVGEGPSTSIEHLLSNRYQVFSEFERIVYSKNFICDPNHPKILEWINNWSCPDKVGLMKYSDLVTHDGIVSLFYNKYTNEIINYNTNTPFCL
jgi:hypothetical protein